MKLKIVRIVAVIICLFKMDSSFALREARAIATDHRIKVMVYNPDDVHVINGYFGYQTSIQFAANEQIDSISVGDSTGWQIIPSGNLLFIKPSEDGSTNMTLKTNLRTYYFELHAKEAIDIRDPDMAFNIRFIYPEDQMRGSEAVAQDHDELIDLKHPENYNFNYSISGAEDIAPVKIFDDGSFTYLQFRDRNNQLPAIFSVDDDLKEALVNYRPSRSHSNLIVIERVYRKLSLRAGRKIVCVFNEAFRLN